MHDEIGPELQRPAQIGRREGGIDRQRQPRAVRHLGDGGNIEHLQTRIAERLGEQQPRLGLDGAGET